MAILDISGSLNILKNQAFMSILKNIDIKFELLKNDILSSIENNTTIFESLLNSYSIDFSRFSSANMNAFFMLSYLDFYAIYAILQSSYSTFRGLLDSTTNKYNYISNLFLDTTDMLVEKKLLKQYRYSLSINFLNNSLLKLENIGNITRDKKLFNLLNTKDVLTLPILSSKIFYPSNIVYTERDISYHDSISNSTQKELDHSIYRKQINKTAITDKIIPNNSNYQNNIIPKVLGTIFGYYSDSIFIKISNIVKEDGEIKSLNIVGSIDAEEWSSETTITLGDYYPILIEGDINTGLKIMFDEEDIDSGDIWTISLKRIDISDPILETTIKFDMLENISYATMSDISNYKLLLSDYKLKDKKFTEFEDLIDIYDECFKKVLTIHKQISELRINLCQKNCDIKTYNSGLVNDYSFKLTDIKAVSNEYLSQGTINFNTIEVNSIRDVILETKEYLYNDTDLKMFIEYNIFVDNDIDKILIPLLKKDTPREIVEYIIPSISADKYIYKTRFPVDLNYGLTIVNLYKSSDSLVVSDTPSSVNPYYIYDTSITDGSINLLTIYMPSYKEQYSYKIKYTPKINSAENAYDNKRVDLLGDGNIDWIAYNSIYYMYYKNFKGEICLALKDAKNNNLTISNTSNSNILILGSDSAALEDTLSGFSGKITSNIEMRSVESQYISPEVYNYKLLIG